MPPHARRDTSRQELKAQLAAQVERVETLQEKLGRIIPRLFPQIGKRHAGGRRRNFSRTWATACKKAGVPGALRRLPPHRRPQHGAHRRAALGRHEHHHAQDRGSLPSLAIASGADLRAAAVLLADGYNHGDNRGPRLTRGV